MKANDVRPNRFSRAIFKIYDILDELKGVPVAFVVFTDEPYLLVPATTDKKVIERFLPLLNFSLMPSQGTRTDRAIKEALRAIEETGAEFGDIFLITDGGEDALEVTDKTEAEIRRAVSGKNRLFVLGVGTPEGGPLFEKEDKPVLNALGRPVKHSLKEGLLKRWAALGAGKYVRAQADGSDVALLMREKSRLSAGEKSSLNDPSLSDTGYWFLILPLIGFPLLFKNGRFLVGLFLVFTSFPARADMIDAFLSPSAAAMRKLDMNEQEAAVALANASRDFTALYNVGTQMISLQKYQQAVDLLKDAVLIRPDDENARVNLEVAERLNKQSSDKTPNAGDNDQASSPEQGGDKDGEGQNEDDEDLNQDNKNDQQHNENKENNNDNSNDKTPPEDDQNDRNDNDGQDDQNKENGGNDPSGRDDNGKDKKQPAAGGNEPAGTDDEKKDGSKSGTGAKDDLLPVHEEPLTLLRYKILFLYREGRYNQEERIGAQW